MKKDDQNVQFPAARHLQLISELKTEKRPERLFAILDELVFFNDSELIFATINEHFMMLYQENALALLHFHLPLLIDHERYYEGLEALDLYDEAPYVSQAVNEDVNNYRRQIKALLTPVRKNEGERIKKLKTKLASNDAPLLYHALEEIVANLNQPAYLELLTPFLMTPDDNELKFYVLHLLLEQNYDGDITMIKHGKKYQQNFRAFQDLFNVRLSEVEAKIFIFMANEKNPLLEQIMMAIAKNHLLYIFPNELEILNSELILHIYYLRAQKLIGVAHDLSTYAIQKKLDLTKLQTLNKTFNDVNLLF